MKQDVLAYWLFGAASIAAGTAIGGGLSFGAEDIFTIGVTLGVSYLLIAFGGLMWIVGSAKMGSE